jgi:hypothetical protein
MKIIRFSLLLVAASLFAVPSLRAEQPAMERAAALTRQAEEALLAASADKGGHRAAALKLLNQALAEINAGIAYDRKTVTPGEIKRRRF